MNDTRSMDQTNELHHFDPSRVDLEGFKDEIRALRREIDASLGEEDITHLRKMERWGRACTFVGLATAGILSDPGERDRPRHGPVRPLDLMHHIWAPRYDHVPGAFR